MGDMTKVIRTSTKDGVTVWQSETCTHTEHTVDAITGESISRGQWSLEDHVLPEEASDALRKILESRSARPTIEIKRLPERKMAIAANEAIRLRALEELAAEAQELDMGY